MKSFWDILRRQNPDAIAIIDNGSPLTYRELTGLAAALGETLKGKEVVALAMEKSAAYVIGMLGCWYAGAAFVPLPPSLPQERRDYMMRHADIGHIVTTEDIARLTPVEPRPAAVKEDTLAYIIYTSGSTGAPKGVMVEHRGIVSFLEAQIAAFDSAPGATWLLYLSILFDASVSDIGVALLSGGTLVIEPPEHLRDGAAFLSCLKRRGITHIDIPPSLLKALRPEDMPATLRTIVIGGEPCPPATVRQWAQRFRVVNVYGPTEATVCTSLCLCDPDTWDKPLVGAPLPGVTYEIIDDELHIGGICLARGYLKDPELTARKFIMQSGQRLYKTGDRVARHADGTIEFLGRIDRQFKLRGQLVEPDEVEARLMSHPAVARAAVLKREERLVAFVVRRGDIGTDALQQYLAKSLPVWMLPQHIEFMDALPQTATGKVDSAALRALPLTSLAAVTPPETELEKKLWDIWHDILKHGDFGVTDDFYAVGGDSLGIIRMTLEAERRGLPFLGTQAGENRTIRGLAAAMKSPADDALPCDWLRHDVAFDAAWQQLFKSAATRPATSGGAILVTGAAGCLGSRLVQELLDKTDADIYCLVRGDAAARIKASSPRIKPLSGDLELPSFGLDARTWDKLAQDVGAVYHCAARVNMVLSYADLHSPNIAATREVLRFCCEGQRKHLHYASTLSVFVATDQNEGRLIETDRLESTKRVYGGYAQTKWAAEWMLLQVPKDACAVTHYRFGLITGDTKTGIGADHDFIAMFARGIAALGAAPAGFDDALAVDITPIDYAAAAMAHLSLQGRHDIYHIANPQSLTLGVFLAALRRRVKVASLPANRWRMLADNKANSAEETAARLSLCRIDAQDFARHRAMDLFQATGVVFDTTHTQADSGLACPAPDAALIDLYISRMLTPRPLKICLFGPESTGKSTLAEKLAAHYKTSFAPEYAKELIAAQNGDITLEDIPRIARGQLATERDAQKAAHDVLFCDSDLLTTQLWSERLFGSCPSWIEGAVLAQDYDLYLLMDIDAPWVDDVHRFANVAREPFMEKCVEALETRKLPYVRLSGSWDDKFAAACRETDRLLSRRQALGA